MEFLGPIIIILFIVAAIVIAYVVWQQERKRGEELSALANELGWRFDASRDRFHDEEYAHFEIFRRGHSRCAYNTLSGDLTIAGREYPAKMGDFTYKITRQSGKSTSTTTYRFSYLIVHLPFHSVPDLLIRREGMFDKIAGVFGFADINFESAEFSRKYHVKCADKKFAYDVITPRMMEFLLRDCPVTIDIERGRCCLSDGSRRWEPAQFRAMVQWVDQFFDQWPDHVTTQLEQA